MQLWQRLYAMVWLAFFEFVLIPRWLGGFAAPIHALLGVLMLALALRNARSLAALPVPARLKRISRATANLVIGQAVLGAGLGVMLYTGLFSRAYTWVDIPHLVLACAILAQTGSLATSYDMWEDRECVDKERGTTDPPPVV
ncbi:MAG: hypothetical protein PHU25_13080 [Deltaproteobacteria bacterium]|nr:hypothetical protein [Deltaproteobacteria bacterium]